MKLTKFIFPGDLPAERVADCSSDSEVGDAGHRGHHRLHQEVPQRTQGTKFSRNTILEFFFKQNSMNAFLVFGF